MPRGNFDVSAARFVRVYPVKCGYADKKATGGVKLVDAKSAASSCALRFEVFGNPTCGSGACRKPKALGVGIPATQATARANADGKITAITVPKVLPRSAFSASSSLSSRSPAYVARLNLLNHPFREGGWAPELKCKDKNCTSDREQFVQVDLGRELEINAVGIQGLASKASWVTRFRVSFSNDGIHWAGSKREFTANNENTQVVKVNLPRPVSARYARIIPTAGNKDDSSYGLRFELYGPKGYRAGETGCRLQRVRPCSCDNSKPIKTYVAPNGPRCGCARRMVQRAAVKGRTIVVHHQIPAQVVRRVVPVSHVIREVVPVAHVIAVPNDFSVVPTTVDKLEKN
jgi:hypothetical protein